MNERSLRLPNINYVIISGRLVSDAELRHTSDGRNFIKFRLASDTPYKSGGEWKSRTVFIDVLFSLGRNDANENVQRRLLKGVGVVVEGQLRYREWETEGRKFSTYEIRGRRVQILERLVQSQEEENLEESFELPPEEGLPEEEMPF